jgi:DNA-binding NarL/FixJ family response regulator
VRGRESADADESGGRLASGGARVPEEQPLSLEQAGPASAYLAPSAESASVTWRVIDRMAQQPTPELADQAVVAGLTSGEREVLGLLARGLSNREIASALVVEESIIRTHVKRILMKLDLRDRVQAVIFAYETGLTRPGARLNNGG